MDERRITSSWRDKSRVEEKKKESRKIKKLGEQV